MAMINKLLVACLLVSSSFLLTQFIALYSFDNFPLTVNSQALLSNVKLLQETFSDYKVNISLVDSESLEIFSKIELSHRKIGVHNHHSCNVFCKKKRTTFLVKGIDIHNKVERISDALLSKSFKVIIHEDYDQREESLENRHGRYMLKYHLFAVKQDTLIHIVITYPRLGHEWSATCDTSKLPNLYRNYLATSRFCNRENVYSLIESVPAVIDGLQLLVPKHIIAFMEKLNQSTFLPCNYDQARIYFSTYGYDKSYESEMFRSKAKHILSIVVDVLKQLDVPFWLSSGTCLGWYRQCDFIPHSKDVDIGIKITDYSGEIISAFGERGLTLKHLFGKIEDSYELSFKIGDIKLDIFFFYEEKDHVWNGGTQARTGKKFKYIFDKFKLCWTTLYSFLVRVPCETNKYITSNYGDAWNTRVKTWDWKASPPNVHENGIWPEHERNRVIQLY